jgi:hypothetical protein
MDSAGRKPGVGIKQAKSGLTDIKRGDFMRNIDDFVAGARLIIRPCSDAT